MASGRPTEVPDSSFETAFPSLAGIAYRVAYRVLGRRDDAEEIAQETLARAHANWSSIRPPTREGWVARVAANLAVDTLRGRRRLWRRWSPAADAPGPDSLAVERADLTAALQSLPRRQREVLALRYLADLSEQATAETLGISVGAVKQHASRALGALRAGGVPAAPHTRVNTVGGR